MVNGMRRGRRLRWRIRERVLILGGPVDNPLFGTRAIGWAALLVCFVRYLNLHHPLQQRDRDCSEQERRRISRPYLPAAVSTDAATRAPIPGRADGRA